MRKRVMLDLKVDEINNNIMIDGLIVERIS